MTRGAGHAGAWGARPQPRSGHALCSPSPLSSASQGFSPSSPCYVVGSWFGAAMRRLCNESVKETRLSRTASFWGKPSPSVSRGAGGEKPRRGDSALSRCGPLRPAGLTTDPRSRPTICPVCCLLVSESALLRQATERTLRNQMQQHRKYLPREMPEWRQSAASC